MAQLGKREMQLMQALWHHGPQTAREIRESLADAPTDATVRTMLRILEDKGYVKHVKRSRAFVYKAAVAERGTVRSLIHQLVEGFFGGSAEGLVAHMVDECDISAESLDKVRKEIAQRKKRESRQ